MQNYKAGPTEIRSANNWIAAGSASVFSFNSWKRSAEKSGHVPSVSISSPIIFMTTLRSSVAGFHVLQSLVS
ncbi:hypothetical protein BELL_0860g00010 [Botrytis elliptica]|uniref:Uncharacterized protein n=1 Tax=Botrytis elliptica TaxID=278938 RepID=A0A4Z1J2L6_9HELO|nr:hypothetical protein BELL_0860g00010 [Botrytis elliptica]